MKQKRIIAVITAATLMLSGSFAAWATEAEDIETLTNLETEAEAIAEAAEVETGESEETVLTYSEEASEDGEINLLDTEETGIEDAELEDIAEILEEDELAEDLEDEEEDEESEDDEDAEDDDEESHIGGYGSQLSTDTSGDTELTAEDLVPKGHIVETGIQTMDNTPYTKFTYSYDYDTFTATVDGHTGDEILDMTVSVVVANEGGYDSVLANDNNSGALSVGKIGWHASLALEVVRLIVAEDNATAWEYLGETLYTSSGKAYNLYDEVVDSSTSWSSRVLTNDEVTVMKNFLNADNNPASKTIQDKLARSYVADYVTKGYNLGIRNAAALVYYADIHNQYGNTGGSMGGAKQCAEYAYVIAGYDWSKVTLNELHLAAITNVAHNYSTRSTINAYLERRRLTYGKLATSGWTYCSSGDYTIPYDSCWSSGNGGAAWLQAALNTYTNAGLSVTGVYDDNLKAAVKAYQEAVGLTADGLAGLHTSTKLISDMYYGMMTSGADMGSINVSSGTSSTGADIVKIDGVWTYTYNGTADYSYTGLAKNSNGWYYMKNGVLDRTYTGFASNSNGSWYITEGKLTRKDNSVIQDTKGAIGTKGEWYYVVGSKVQYDFTGLANYSNSSGWWYITKGVLDRSYQGLAKNNNGWYYLTNGKVDRSYTGFATNENGSWYMTEGKLTRKDNTVIKDTKGTLGTKGEWYYVVGSKVQYDFTGLANYKNSSGWWYITKGVVDRTVNTVAKNKNGWYYVVNGKVQKSFTGLANYKNASGWWYITNGRVDRTFTGIAKNINGWYYIKDGKVQHGFNGTVTVNGVKYAVKNGKVDM